MGVCVCEHMWWVWVDVGVCGMRVFVCGVCVCVDVVSLSCHVYVWMD